MSLTIRPRKRRHFKATLLITGGTALFLLCTAGAALDKLSGGRPLHTALVVAALVVLAVPVVAHTTLVVMNNRHLALAAEGTGLRWTNWTGRQIHIAHPDAARLYPVAVGTRISGRLLVVSGRAGESPVVLVPNWWVPAELGEVFDALDLPVVDERPVTLGELARRHAGAWLPFSLRRPVLYTLSVMVPIFGYLFGMTYLITHL